MVHQLLKCALLLALSFPANPQQPKSGGQTEPTREPRLPDISGTAIAKLIRPALPPPGPGTPSEQPPSERCKCCGQKLQPELTKTAPDSVGREVVILSLRGKFDFVGIDGGSISPDAIDIMLQLAKERKPVAIVLDIDSGGGLVTVMHKLMKDLLAMQQDEHIRVIAWPREAYSAAAVSTLTCKEVVVRPTTRLGAATKVVGNDEAPVDNSAMGQKRAAVEAALMRQVSEVTGVDRKVFDAMMIPRKQLWYRDGSGFTDKAPTGRPVGTKSAGDGWLELDGSAERPAAFSAEELLRTHLAKARATTESELLAACGLPAGTAICRIDLADPKVRAKTDPVIAKIVAWNAWRSKELQAYQGKLTGRIQPMARAIQQAQVIKGAQWDQKSLDALGNAIDNCKNLPPVTGDARRALAYSEGPDGGSLDEWLDTVYADYQTIIRLAEGAVRPKTNAGARVIHIADALENLEKANKLLAVMLMVVREE